MKVGAGGKAWLNSDIVLLMDFEDVPETKDIRRLEGRGQVRLRLDEAG